MVYNYILVRLGDLTLKGKNQNVFLRRLYNLINLKLQGLDIKIEYRHDRIYIDPKNEKIDVICERLDLVSGISSYSLVVKCSDDLKDIKENALKLVSEVAKPDQTFKVDTKRADKNYPLLSLEVSQQVAGFVLSQVKFLKVDVHNPELHLHVEIRNKSAYLYISSIRALGGFPVGVAGKGLLLMSGGIDSPVAGILAMRQGIEVECIHFESTPLTSIESAQKVVDLAKVMAKYTQNNEIKIHFVPFKELHMALLDNVPESYTITIMRRMMYRIASKFAIKNDDLCLISGESVGQVASQTLGSMRTINDVTNLPVLRPLCTTDKVDIISYAQKFKTFDISIRPFEDCCTVYVPKNPTTNPKIDKAEAFEKAFDFETLVNEAVEGIRTLSIKPDSNLDFSLLGLEVRDVLDSLNK